MIASAENLSKKWVTQICPFCQKEAMKAVMENEKHTVFQCEYCGEFRWLPKGE